MRKLYEEIKRVFDSETSFRVLLVLGIAIVLLVVFSAGVNVGFRKASFGRAWGDNYERNFGMHFGRPMMLERDNFPNAHGATGQILKINLPSIVVQDRDKTEKVVLIKEDTQIHERMESVSPQDLKVDDFVVVIGNPNAQGQIEAKLIRIMPMGIFPSPSFPGPARQ